MVVDKLTKSTHFIPIKISFWLHHALNISKGRDNGNTYHIQLPHMIEYEHVFLLTKLVLTRSIDRVLLLMHVMNNVIHDNSAIPVVPTTTGTTVGKLSFYNISWIKEWLISATVVLTNFDRALYMRSSPLQSHILQRQLIFDLELYLSSIAHSF